MTATLNQNATAVVMASIEAIEREPDGWPDRKNLATIRVRVPTAVAETTPRQATRNQPTLSATVWIGICWDTNTVLTDSINASNCKSNIAQTTIVANVKK